jgi:hypothetical protein
MKRAAKMCLFNDSSRGRNEKIYIKETNKEDGKL